MKFAHNVRNALRTLLCKKHNVRNALRTLWCKKHNVRNALRTLRSKFHNIRNALRTHYGRITDVMCERAVRYCAKYMRCNGFKLDMMVEFHATKVSLFFQRIWIITTRAIMIQSSLRTLLSCRTTPKMAFFWLKFGTMTIFLQLWQKK